MTLTTPNPTFDLSTPDGRAAAEKALRDLYEAPGPNGQFRRLADERDRSAITRAIAIAERCVDEPISVDSLIDDYMRSASDWNAINVANSIAEHLAEEREMLARPWLARPIDRTRAEYYDEVVTPQHANEITLAAVLIFIAALCGAYTVAVNGQGAWAFPLIAVAAAMIAAVYAVKPRSESRRRNVSLTPTELEAKWSKAEDVVYRLAPIVSALGRPSFAHPNLSATSYTVRGTGEGDAHIAFTIRGHNGARTATKDINVHVSGSMDPSPENLSRCISEAIEDPVTAIKEDLILK
jgi:hypothetical protein